MVCPGGFFFVVGFKWRHVENEDLLIYTPGGVAWIQTREKKTSKMDKSGFTEEQLLQQQQELFKSSVEKYNQAGTTEP